MINNIFLYVLIRKKVKKYLSTAEEGGPDKVQRFNLHPTVDRHRSPGLVL